MERYFIVCRCWKHFSPDFPFEKFDDVGDDEILDAVEKYTAEYPCDRKSRFRKRANKKVGRLAVALEKRAKQITHRPSGHSDSPQQTEQIEFEAEPECSPGCQNAYRMGWISCPLRKFGGLSPSPQWFLVPADGEQCAREAVDALNKLLPSTEGWVDYGHLRIRFGYLPASRFDTAKQIEIELGMEDLPILTPNSFAEDVQQQIADVAPRVVAKVFDILNPDAERPKTPPTVHDVNTTARAAQAPILQIGLVSINVPQPSAATGTPEDQTKAIPRKWLPEALLLVRDHPEWADSKIADIVGVHPSTLSRDETYKASAALTRSNKNDPPKGHRTAGGAIEAYGPDQP